MDSLSAMLYNIVRGDGVIDAAVRERISQSPVIINRLVYRTIFDIHGQDPKIFVEVIKLLLNTPSMHIEFGYQTALTFAIKKTCYDDDRARLLPAVVDAILELGADINEPNHKGRYPINYVFYYAHCHKSINYGLTVLLERGARPQLYCMQVLQALVINHGFCIQVLAILESYGFAPNPDNIPPAELSKICSHIGYSDRWKFLERIIVWGFNPTTITDLIYISYSDGEFDMDLLRHLIDIGAPLFDEQGGIQMIDLLRHSVSVGEIIGAQIIIDAALLQMRENATAATLL